MILQNLELDAILGDTDRPAPVEIHATEDNAIAVYPEEGMTAYVSLPALLSDHDIDPEILIQWLAEQGRLSDAIAVACATRPDRPVPAHLDWYVGKLERLKGDISAVGALRSAYEAWLKGNQ